MPTNVAVDGILMRDVDHPERCRAVG